MTRNGFVESLMAALTDIGNATAVQVLHPGDLRTVLERFYDGYGVGRVLAPSVPAEPPRCARCGADTSLCPACQAQRAVRGIARGAVTGLALRVNDVIDGLIGPEPQR